MQVHCFFAVLSIAAAYAGALLIFPGGVFTLPQVV